MGGANDVPEGNGIGDDEGRDEPVGEDDDEEGTRETIGPPAVGSTPEAED
jgi:hypothetical protein